MNVDILNAAAKAALASRRAAVEEHLKRMHVDGTQAGSVTGNSAAPSLGPSLYGVQSPQYAYSAHSLNAAPANTAQGL